MKITLVSGSHRRHSQSGKVGRFLERTLKEHELWREIRPGASVWGRSRSS